MEDQQSPASDVTDETLDSRSGDDASVEIDAAGTEVEQPEPEVLEDQSTIDPVSDDETGDDKDDLGVRARQPAGRRLGIAVVVAAALFIGCTAFAAAMNRAARWVAPESRSALKRRSRAGDIRDRRH